MSWAKDRLDLSALLDRDHGPLALIGVSLGGLFARDLAYDRLAAPKRRRATARGRGRSRSFRKTGSSIQ